MLSHRTTLQNRYQMIRQLGVGGMGAADRARHLPLNQPVVALKHYECAWVGRYKRNTFGPAPSRSKPK